MGQKETSILPFYGIGGSYIVQFDMVPVAAGTFIYVNHEDTNEDELNADLRLGLAFENFCMDLAGGVGVPLKSKKTEQDTTSESFLVIDEIFFHGGIEMFLGTTYYGGIFASVGIQSARMTRSDGSKISVSGENAYVIVEPRLMFNKAKLTLAFFSFPQETVNNLFFIDDSMGINLCFVTEELIITNNKEVKIGSNLTYSVPGKTIEDAESLFDTSGDGEDPNFKISPFVNIETGKSTYQAMIQILASDLADKAKDSIKINLSFKSLI